MVRLSFSMNTEGLSFAIAAITFEAVSQELRLDLVAALQEAFARAGAQVGQGAIIHARRQNDGLFSCVVCKLLYLQHHSMCEQNTSLRHGINPLNAG